MTQPNPPQQDTLPDGTPKLVEMFRLDLTVGEACVLHTVFSTGTAAASTDPKTVARRFHGLIHVVLQHAKDYESLVNKLDQMGEWHNAHEA